MRKFFLLIPFLFLNACGLQPIYKTDSAASSDQGQSYNQELAAIQIEVTRKKLNQDLKNNLEKVLNPNDIKVEPKYSISITLQRSLVSTFTNFTGSSGRDKVVLVANYNLKDLASGDVIASGSTTAKDNFNVEDKRFANYIAEESIASNLTLIIAQNIRNLLVNDIINNYKNKKKEEASK